MGSLEDAARNIIEKQKQAEREKIESERRKQRLEKDPTLEDNYRVKVNPISAQWLREYANFMRQYSITPIPCVTTRLGTTRKILFIAFEQVIQLLPIGFSAWPLEQTKYAVSEQGWLIKATLTSSEKFSQETIFSHQNHYELSNWVPTPPGYESHEYEYKRKLAWEFPKRWPMMPLLLLSRIPPRNEEPSYFNNENDRSTTEGDICLGWNSHSTGSGDDVSSWYEYFFLHKLLVNSMVRIKQARDRR